MTYEQGSSGDWWTIGADSNIYARYLAIHDNATNPEVSLYKTFGFPVRCVVVKFTTTSPVNIY